MFSPEIHYYEDLHKSKQMKNMLFKKYFNQLCGVANIWSCAKWLTLCGTLVDERNECFGDSNAHWCKTPLYLAAVVWLCQILTSCFSESKKTGGVWRYTIWQNVWYPSHEFSITNRYLNRYSRPPSKSPLYLAAVVWLCQILTSCFSEFKKTGGVFVGSTLLDKKVNTSTIHFKSKVLYWQYYVTSAGTNSYWRLHWVFNWSFI